MWLLHVLLGCGLLLVWPCNLARSQTLEGKTLKIVTIINDPFVMPVRQSSKEGPDGGFTGYYIDMIKLLQRELKFNYEIYEVADGKYGMPLEDGKWNGLIGDIVEQRANLTLAALSITSNRLKSVDFTVPVSSSGMSILYKKPNSKSTSMSTSSALVFKPFALSTWILLLLMYIIYTALAFAIWMLSPYEQNHRSLMDTSIITRAKKAGCGAWLFVTGGLFLQGFARTPKAPSARILAFVWWLFSLIIVSCYVANLVPQVMQLRKSPLGGQPIVKDLKDLVQQSTMSYGFFQNGSTQKMFEESTLPEHKAAVSYLSKNPQHYVTSIAQAMEKVRAGNYAWIAEGLTADYYALSSCDIVSFSIGLSVKDYGLAVAKGSNLKPLLDEAILKIKGSGELGVLRNRWWSRAIGPCDNEAVGKLGAGSGSSSDSLLPGDLTCLFVLLLIGGVVAMVVLPVELRLKAAAFVPVCGSGAAKPSSKPEMDKAAAPVATTEVEA